MGAVAFIARISRRAFCWGAIILAASVMKGASQQDAAGRHVLQRDGFAVTIETSVRRATPRFDETAAVSAVRWNGRNWLTGAGLADEFGLEGFGVLGFKEAPIGGDFVKIGVGVLTRDVPGPYRFQHSYPRRSEFAVQVIAGETEVKVAQRSGEVNGYGYDYAKTYTIEAAGRLVIAYELTNRGGLTFRFEHYNHNFFGVKTAGGAGGSRIETPLRLQNPPEGWSLVSDHDARWVGADFPAPGRFWRMPMNPAAEGQALKLSLKDGYSVRMTGSSAVTRLSVWVDETAICPELFSRFTLEPGETARWTRTYEFFESGERSSAL